MASVSTISRETASLARKKGKGVRKCPGWEGGGVVVILAKREESVFGQTYMVQPCAGLRVLQKSCTRGPEYGFLSANRKGLDFSVALFSELVKNGVAAKRVVFGTKKGNHSNKSSLL